ncbi:MAG: Crp/Fnr family transcriptional regulator [Gemmatimonadetes bacterium]|nr:Crp/Fnr family transcriptional regulator [Gemmatimonadota bacterium]
MTRGAQKEDLSSVLASSPLLRGVGKEALKELAAMARCHDYPKNNILLYQGDPAGPVFLVVRGSVKVTLAHEAGREVVIARARSGGLVGLVSALDGRPQPANAITETASHLAKFDGEPFIAWMEQQKATQQAVLRDLSQSVRRAYQKIGEHALLGVKERVLYALLEIAEQEGEPERASGYVVFTRPTLQDLAQRVGSSREVVSRIMKELLESDLLRAEGRVIRVSASALVVRED